MYQTKTKMAKSKPEMILDESPWKLEQLDDVVWSQVIDKKLPQSTAENWHAKQNIDWHKEE